jgi:tetratricopeptide (TPR) repeat protein
MGLLAAILLAAILYGAVWLKKTVDTVGARVAAALVWVAVASALLAALFYRDDAGPLLRAAPLIALPVWAALGAVASTAAGHFLGSSFKNRRMGALVVVLAAGALQYLNAAAFLGSTDKMWRDALLRDISNEPAIGAFSRSLLRKYKYDDARKVADKCLTAHPEACACLEVRAKVAAQRVADRCFAAQAEACACQPAQAAAAMRNQLLDAALSDARAADAACPDRPMAKAVLAEVLALRGENAEAEQEATEGLALGGLSASAESRLHYALALAQQGDGRFDEASEHLKQALKVGAGRDAKLLAGALALVKEDLDEAERRLGPLVKANPRDPDAAYNLALVADRRGNYNLAREGYLNTLKADPCYASARYNLAHLTWKAGIQDEARHHAQKFAEMAAPGDPMVAQLSALVGIPLPQGNAQ